MMLYPQFRLPFFVFFLFPAAVLVLDEQLDQHFPLFPSLLRADCDDDDFEICEDSRMTPPSRPVVPALPPVQ